MPCTHPEVVDSPEDASLLRGPAFTRATAVASDVPDVKLRQRGLHNVTRGVWSRQVPTTWRERALATAIVLPPQSAFSHGTAALLHGFSLPRKLQEPVDLDVITPTSRAQRRRPGWVGHRGGESRTIVAVHDLPVTDPIDTWIDLAAWTLGRAPRLTVDDLIVIGDEVLNAVIATGIAGSNRSRLGFAQRHLDPLVVEPAVRLMSERIASRVGPRGKSSLGVAMEFVRAGVKSPQETRARLMFVRAGFPEPLVNANIHVEGGGGWLGEGDLVWKKAKTVAEYQSEHHADRKRRSVDSDRLAIFRDEDWHTHEVWAEDLRPGARQHALFQRVRASLARWD